MLTGAGDPLKNVEGGRFKYLDNTSYFDFLKNNYGVSHPKVLQMLRIVVGDYYACGTDCLSVFEAAGGGAPGLTGDILFPVMGKKLYDKFME